MSAPASVTMTIDDITKAVNNITVRAKLIWVDPAPCTSSTHIIRATISDHSRSIRLTLWGFDDGMKEFLTAHMMQIFSFEGLTARAHPERYLMREHNFSLSLNATDRAGLRFVGRCSILNDPVLNQRFLDIVVPQPLLMGQTPLPATHLPPSQGGFIMSRSQSQQITSATHPAPKVLFPASPGSVVEKRERPADAFANWWKCPKHGCRLSGYQFCMVDGSAHPEVCAKCGTQGKYLYCPASPPGSMLKHSDMVTLAPTSAVPTVLSLETPMFTPHTTTSDQERTKSITQQPPSPTNIQEQITTSIETHHNAPDALNMPATTSIETHHNAPDAFNMPATTSVHEFTYHEEEDAKKAKKKRK